MLNINPYLKAFAVALITCVITIINSNNDLGNWRTWVLPVSAVIVTYLVPNAKQSSGPTFPSQ